MGQTIRAIPAPAPAIARRRLVPWRVQAQRLLAYAGLTFFGWLFLMPFAWLVVTSLKTSKEVLKFPPTWIPRPFAWSNYPDVFRQVEFLTYIRNTLFYASFAVVGTVISCSLAAYGFARIKWPGRDVLFVVVLATLMLPGQVTLIPLYVLFSKLHWIGDYRPLIVPSFFGNAFYIFLLRQFFMTIPGELADAARVDGANEFEIYRRIVLPLSKPALATVALFTFMDKWNDFLGPLIYLTDESKWPLSIGLQAFQGQHRNDWALLMAASAMMTIPLILLYFFTQRTFIQGITLTGVKG